jgi:type VI secretion system secreted protein VgrG
MPYKLVTDDGETYYGFTDYEGKTMRVASAEATNVTVHWGELPPSGA